MSCELESFKTYMVHLNWNKKTMTQEMSIYEYKYPTNIPIYKVRPEMYSFDFENPVH